MHKFQTRDDARLSRFRAKFSSPAFDSVDELLSGDITQFKECAAKFYLTDEEVALGIRYQEAQESLMIASEAKKAAKLARFFPSNYLQLASLLPKKRSQPRPAGRPYAFDDNMLFTCAFHHFWKPGRLKGEVEIQAAKLIGAPPYSIAKALPKTGADLKEIAAARFPSFDAAQRAHWISWMMEENLQAFRIVLHEIQAEDKAAEAERRRGRFSEPILANGSVTR